MPDPRPLIILLTDCYDDQEGECYDCGTDLRHPGGSSSAPGRSAYLVECDDDEDGVGGYKLVCSDCR